MNIRSFTAAPRALLAAALLFAALLALAGAPRASAGGHWEQVGPEGGALTGSALSFERESALFARQDLNEFARENLPSFQRFTLDNGIPFLFKRSATNRVFSLKTVIVGHTMYTPVDKAGLEAVTLTMLTKGSERYSYEETKRLQYEKSSGIGPAIAGFDLTSFDLGTLDQYLPELFDLYADAFLHPSWDPDEFTRVMNDFKVAKQKAENDPYSLAVVKLHEVLFRDHPYLAYWDGFGDSLEHITLDDVKQYYRTMLAPERMFIVAVGDFDPARLTAMLNASFGRIAALPAASGTAPLREPPSLTGRVPDGLTEVPFEHSEGLAYVRGDFALPPSDDPDFPAILVAFTMLDDILFDVVRTQNGAAYSVWARAYPYKASYGALTVYKTAVPGTVRALLDRSIEILAGGRSLAARPSVSAEGKSGIGAPVDARSKAGTYVPVAEALPFYQDQAINRFYAGQETNTSVAAQIASSVVYHGDYRDYLLFLDRIRAVTADQVVAVTKRYLVGAPIAWVALGSPDVLAQIDANEYRRPTP